MIDKFTNYEVMGDKTLTHQIIDIIQFRCVKEIERNSILYGHIDSLFHMKNSIEHEILDSLKKFIEIQEIEEFGSIRFIGEISLPLITNEKIKELNNDIYYLNEDALKQRIEIKRLNDWIKQPWYRKLYWRLK